MKTQQAIILALIGAASLTLSGLSGCISVKREVTPATTTTTTVRPATSTVERTTTY